MLHRLKELPSFLLRKIGSRGIKRAHRWLVEAYCAPHSWYKDRLISFLFQLRNFFSLLISGFEFTITRWEGASKVDHRPMSVVYFADRKSTSYRSPDYLENILFQPDSARREDLGRCNLWQLRWRAASLGKQADLVILERNHILAWTPSRGDWVKAPVWLRHSFVLSEGETWEQVLKRMRQQNRNLRLVRRAGFKPVISRDENDYDFFYERMHVPLIRHRHKDYGTISKKATLHQQFEVGMLMFVQNAEGQLVAADLLQEHHDVLFNIVGGVLDGDSEWYDRGALSALYYYEIEYAHQHGLKLLDAGGTRAFTNDGVYQHKQRWGMTPGWNWWEPSDWLFWAPNSSEVALRWMEANPIDPGVLAHGGQHIEQLYRGERGLSGI